MEPVVLRLDGPSASEALEDARAEVMALGLAHRAFLRFQAPGWPPGIAWLADAVYSLALRHVVTEPPREALLSWNAWLQPHRDRTAPGPCLNAAVILRRAAAGGKLVIGDRPALECLDGDLVLFDGQEVHEVTPVVSVADEGYRASLLYYLPVAP